VLFYARSISKCLLGVGFAMFTWTSHAQDLPWHLGSLSGSETAPAAINTAAIKPGPHPVVVAVIDGGILANHPSLTGRLLPGYDMLSAPNNLKGGRSADFGPDSRDAKCGERISSATFRTHGTEVASLIAGNGQEGVVGVNPSAKILPIRLFGACHISRSDLLDSLNWAAGMPVAGVPLNPHPARVINLSFSGGKTVCGDDLQQLIDSFAKKKIFVVAAVGNTFGKKLAEPANCRGVISVGAVDAENHIENYSALDERTVIYAPGGGKPVAGTNPWRVNKLKVASYDLDFKGDERPVSPFRGVGTSYAAPLVSGFVSLLLSHHQNMGPTDFMAQLPKYTRAVNTSIQCPSCNARGLTMSASAN
jgi:serine protease